MLKRSFEIYLNRAVDIKIFCGVVVVASFLFFSGYRFGTHLERMHCIKGSHSHVIVDFVNK